MKIARVYWRDSRMYITQHDDKEKLEVCHIESVGFMLKNTNFEIVLVGDLIDGEFRRTLIIPKENIANLYLDEIHVNPKTLKVLK